MSHYEIQPSRTQYDFIMSRALENCIMGPRGEGKTESGLMAMTYHASEQVGKYRPIPWACVRDTWSNLERTTLQSLLNPRPGSFAASIRNELRVMDGGKRVQLPGLWDLWLFGCDTLPDLNKLQSMSLGGFWLEEAAPAAGVVDIGSGISEDVWLMGISSLRHPVTTNRRAQITMNPCDEDHWVWLRFKEEVEARRRLFMIQKGENVHIDNQYRENMREALKTRPDMLMRLVEGRPTMVQRGVQVMPEYTEANRADVVYEPIPNTQVIRFWDGGLTPACVIGQITPRGQFRILDCLTARNSGMIQLIKTQVIPLLQRRYGKITMWRDTGDPALNERDQSDSTQTAAQIINQELKTAFEPGASEWSVRRESFKELLNRRVDGEPMFMLSSHLTFLHRGLRGGWHYLKTKEGVVQRDIPVKNEYSHPCDALSHGIPLIFKYEDTSSKVSYISNPKRRALSYSVPNLDYIGVPRRTRYIR